TGLSYPVSTSAWPDWSFSAMDPRAEALNRKVALALMSMPPQPGITGWTYPIGGSELLEMANGIRPRAGQASGGGSDFLAVALNFLSAQSWLAWGLALVLLVVFARAHVVAGKLKKVVEE